LVTTTVGGIKVTCPFDPNQPGPAGHYIYDLHLSIPFINTGLSLDIQATAWIADLMGQLNVGGYKVSNVKVSTPNATTLRIEMDESSPPIAVVALAILGVVALTYLIQAIDVTVQNVTNASNPLIWVMWAVIILLVVFPVGYWVYTHWEKVQGAITTAGREARSGYKRVKQKWQQYVD